MLCQSYSVFTVITSIDDGHHYIVAVLEYAGYHKMHGGFTRGLIINDQLKHMFKLNFLYSLLLSLSKKTKTHIYESCMNN